MRWDSGWVVESRYQVGWKEFRKDSRWKNTNKKQEMTLSPDNISQKQTTYFPAKGKICTLFFKLITLIALCRLHSDVVLPMLFCEIPTFFCKIYQVIEHDPNLIPQSYSWSLLIILTFEFGSQINNDSPFKGHIQELPGMWHATFHSA